MLPDGNRRDAVFSAAQPYALHDFSADGLSVGRPSPVMTRCIRQFLIKSGQIQGPFQSPDLSFPFRKTISAAPSPPAAPAPGLHPC